MARDDKGPQRLRDLLGDVGRRLGVGDPRGTGVLWSRWEQIVGSGIAAHAEPTSLKEGVLRIRTETPTWATEIGYLGADIARLVNETVGSQVVQEVRVWTGPGPIKRAARATPSPVPPPTPQGGLEKGAEGASGRTPPADPLTAFERARSAWSKRVGNGSRGGGSGPSRN